MQNILAGAWGFCSDRELHGHCSIGIVWVRLKNNLGVKGGGISVNSLQKLQWSLQTPSPKWWGRESWVWNRYPVTSQSSEQVANRWPKLDLNLLPKRARHNCSKKSNLTCHPDQDAVFHRPVALVCHHLRLVWLHHGLKQLEHEGKNVSNSFLWSELPNIRSILCNPVQCSSVSSLPTKSFWKAYKLDCTSSSASDTSASKTWVVKACIKIQVLLSRAYYANTFQCFGSSSVHRQAWRTEEKIVLKIYLHRWTSIEGQEDQHSAKSALHHGLGTPNLWKGTIVTVMTLIDLYCFQRL